MSSTGWTDKSQKDIELAVPRTTWTDLVSIGAEDGVAIGPNILNPQLYATLPAKPTGKETILIRWARMGQPDGDARYTQRQPCDMGDRVGWSATMYSSLEFVSADDLPLVLQVYHTCPATSAKPKGEVVFTTIIPKAHNPAAYVGARATPDPDD